MGAGAEPVAAYDPQDDARRSFDVAVDALRSDLLSSRKGLAYGRHVPGETFVEVCLQPQGGAFTVVAVEALSAIAMGNQLVAMGLAALKPPKL